jgi:ABC-type glutathione transport system ATPase component
LNIAIVIVSYDLGFLTKISGRIILRKDGIIAVDIAPQAQDAPIDFRKGYS